MVNEHNIFAVILATIKTLVIIVIPFVEPQIAGILGGIAYIIIRHEAKIEPIKFRKFVIVIFFGWLGAWATVNIISEHFINCPHVWEHIASATVGFLMYDILLMLGTNSKSVVGFFGKIVGSIIERGAGKIWK